MDRTTGGYASAAPIGVIVTVRNEDESRVTFNVVVVVVFVPTMRSEGELWSEKEPLMLRMSDGLSIVIDPLALVCEHPWIKTCIPEPLLVDKLRNDELMSEILAFTGPNVPDDVAGK